MNTWTTQTGEEIAYQDITDSHLLNILKFIKRRANEGVECFVGGWDWRDYDSYTIYGKEVLDHFNYKELRQEARKRGILNTRKMELKQPF